MVWKQINGRFYYYRSVREAGRVRSEYVGGGETASLIARLDAFERNDRESMRRAWKDERDEAEAEDREMTEFFDRVGAVADAAMEAAGFRKHHRGEWRKTRGEGQ